MLTETLKTLLGGPENRSFVYEVGPSAFYFFLLLVNEYESGRWDKISDWEWRLQEPKDGDAIVVRVEYSDLRDVMSDTTDGVKNYVSSLKGSDWIYDYKFGDKFVDIVVGVSLSSVVSAKVLAVEERIENKISESKKVADRSSSIDKNSFPSTNINRADLKGKISKAKSVTEEQKKKTYELHKENVNKIVSRTSERYESQNGRTGSEHHNDRISHKKDEDGNYIASPRTVVEAYETGFIDKYKFDPPKLYTKSNNFSKKAKKLISVGQEYSFEEALQLVEFCIERWDDIKENKYVSDYPTPDDIWRIRTEFCMAIRAGKDVEDVLLSSNEDKPQDKGEWTEPDYDPEKYGVERI